MIEFPNTMFKVLEIACENVLLLAAGTLTLSTLYGIIYRLYLSPISSFPGPKLAALTMWYEFYYDIFPGYGQYAFHIRDLHAKYGPIIRINPYELHVSTAQFYETLYSAHKKRDKWFWLTRTFGMPTSTFATPEHGKHRVRRAALNPFFSSASVRRLQPVIEERVQTCIERIRDLALTGKVERVVLITSAFATGELLGL
jgi:cytochrome P450